MSSPSLNPVDEDELTEEESWEATRLTVEKAVKEEARRKQLTIIQEAAIPRSETPGTDPTEGPATRSTETRVREMTATMQRLLWLHRVAAILHAALFIGMVVWAVKLDDKLWRNGIPVIVWCPVFEFITFAFETLASDEKWLRRRLTANACVERWIEYSVTASMMMVAIVQLTNEELEGVYAVTVICTIVTMWFGYELELEWRGWLFTIGCLIMSVPWIIVLYNQGHQDPPNFVYWIVGSMIMFFSAFAVVSYVGRDDATYHDRDKWYTFLSFSSKIALCIQIGAGASRPDERDP
jgi:hypothetical protein